MLIWPSRKGKCTAGAAPFRTISALSRAAPGPRQDSYACSLKVGKSAIQDYPMFRPSGSLWTSTRPDEATKGLAKVLLAPDDLGRSLFGPPGIPADRIKVLREGFMKMMKDPDVLAEAQKKGLEPNPISGDEMEGLVKELVQPAEVIQRMKTFLQN